MTFLIATTRPGDGLCGYSGDGGSTDGWVDGFVDRPHPTATDHVQDFVLADLVGFGRSHGFRRTRFELSSTPVRQINTNTVVPCRRGGKGQALSKTGNPARNGLAVTSLARITYHVTPLAH